MLSHLNGLLTRRQALRGGVGAAALAATVSTATGCAMKASKLAIVHTNDTHGHDLLNEESLGMAAVTQLKKDWEAKGYEVLLMDAGDAVQGENLVNHSKGDTAVDFMNVTGYDVMCLGNHEFDFGQDKVEEHVKAANFPMLSANIIVDATGQNLVEQRTTFTLSDGTKVGVFGLTTPETYTKVNPLFVRGLTFLEGEELYQCAQEQIDALRSEGCKLVVCLAHLGEDDVSDPNRAKDVVAHTSGLDLMIDGHDHKEENALITNKDGEDVLVVETGCYTHAVGVVTWEGGKLDAHLEKFGEYKGQDGAVAEHIKTVADQVSDELGEVLATTDFLLDGERLPGVRNKETNLGDLVADAVMWEAQKMADDEPDCAIVNGGAIRMSIAEGDITRGDVLNVLPFVNYVCTIKVTGAQLLESIEASCAGTPDEMGGFPQVSGIKYTVDTLVPYAAGEAYPDSTYKAPAMPGSRVTIHDVGGKGFDKKATYTIASNDFLCAGGDTYYVFAQAADKTMKDINYLVSDCLVYYLTEVCGGKVPDTYKDPAGQGRIKVVVGDADEKADASEGDAAQAA